MTRAAVLLSLGCAHAPPAPVPAAPPPVAWPLKIGPTGRYLVDQHDVPFPIHGDTAWSLATYSTRAQIDTYFDDRQARGFNTVLFEIIQVPYYGGPLNREGQAPFLVNGDPSAPNDAFF